ncbi:DUF3842 family protein [Clostridium aminobutyricum]|uniref:DUF3842 family protein n=1 Tax=Clostridium aminobutyricum TaxID=33953 RepID=A0A939IHV9_CLOAM|nr:DUF3842 family protein [Clostridium aminobutyricum]MBN7771869.1 DUF3842 family protein [Clostridium aminobutyricum]
MIIAVVDGQGGGIGKAIVEKVKAGFPKTVVYALGTNSVATGQMLRAGADEGATGENAIVHNMKRVDVVVGVIGILNANSMMGELTPKMAEAIGSSPAQKILLPLNRCHIHVVSVKELSIGQHIDNAVLAIKEYIQANAGSEDCRPV